MKAEKTDERKDAYPQMTQMYADEKTKKK